MIRKVTLTLGLILVLLWLLGSCNHTSSITTGQIDTGSTSPETAATESADPSGESTTDSSSEYITYSQVQCSFDADLSFETIGNALKELLPEDFKESSADESTLLKNNVLSMRNWRKNAPDVIDEFYTLTEYDSAETASMQFLFGGSSPTHKRSDVRIGACVLEAFLTDGNCVKSLLRNLGLIDTVPAPRTVTAAVTAERNERVSAYVEKLRTSGNIKREENENNSAVLFFDATGGESVYCEDIKERIGPDNRTKEELDQIIAEMTEAHYPNYWFYEGTRIIYDDHYFLTGIVYPMEEYLTDTSE